jgi:hypothetical protein
MGLDMYLHAKRYFSCHEYNAANFMPDLMNVVGLGAVAVPLDENFQSMEVQVQVAYWRKANQIHNWFVKNVQRGEDDCEEYDVSRGQLEQLRKLCKQALRKKDPALLPPAEGFFFGSTEVDEYYWEQLKETVSKLTRVLDAPVPEDTYFTYRSSW